MINPLTNGITLVHESRVAEYEAMGYFIASNVIAEVEATEVVSKTVKKAVKKKATKE